MLDNEMKSMLNELQNHMSVNGYDTLLIFDTHLDLERWKNEMEKQGEDFDDITLTTMYDLIYGRVLIGRKFRAYQFMLNEKVNK